MRSTKNKTEFFMKMKKKPALQDILDRIDSLSVEDIDNTSQPMWTKTELKRYKENDGFTSPAIIAAKMIANSPQPTKDIVHVYRYIGESKYVANIEIIESELVAVINFDLVKVGHSEINIKYFNSKELQFIKKVDTLHDFGVMVNEENWQRLAPGENREEEVLGPKPLYTIRRIE